MTSLLTNVKKDEGEIPCVRRVKDEGEINKDEVEFIKSLKKSIEKKQNEVIITLTTKDNFEFKCPYEILKWSGLISAIIENDGDSDDDDENEDEEELLTEIPLKEVDSNTLQKIIDFLKKYTREPFKDPEKPLISDKLEEIIDKEWCVEFIKSLKKKTEELFKIIKASNYMDIKPLLNLTCAVIASEIKGKTPEEIREIFGIDEEDEEEDEEDKEDEEEGLQGLQGLQGLRRRII
jgi:S-phase kinase-associated protein 1